MLYHLIYIIDKTEVNTHSVIINMKVDNRMTDSDGEVYYNEKES